ncbi:MAG: formylglycine-generating enzyme family protein [Verrucomicrobiaceae bacterium]
MLNPFPLLKIEASIPSRWQAGAQRLAQLRLHNPTEADLTSLHVKAVWRALAGGVSPDFSLPLLKRGTCVQVELSLTPEIACEDVLQIHIFTEVGPYLCLNLCSKSLTPMVRALVPQQHIQIHVQETKVGDKPNFGQVIESGGMSHIGPQIHLSGRDGQLQIEEWLQQGKALEEFEALPVYVVSESCHAWTSNLGTALVGVPAGRFSMGATPSRDAEARPDEGPVREVQLERSFWMGRHPVTQEEWRKVMTDLPELEPAIARHHTGDQMPVARITWHQAREYCRRLTLLERSAGALPPGYAYRLPTEVEWEYACRAGTTGSRYAQPLAEIAACAASGRHFTTVGRFRANPWGLHDMLGLVREWCYDALAPYRPFETHHPVNDTRADASVPRVTRGGCYQDADAKIRASARDARLAEDVSQRVGFRVVLAHESAWS